MGLVCSSAPVGGLETKGSSSEELSSDAPRINLRRSLASGPELNLGLGMGSLKLTRGLEDGVGCFIVTEEVSLGG